MDAGFVEKTNDIVCKAGELLKKLSVDPEMRKPQKKGDGSPVTPADLEVSQFLVKELATLGFLVISEECLPENPPAHGETYFLVDPLDGTKYFSRGEDEFAICVGLISEGRPVYGAIYDPTQSRLFWAKQGSGAYCDKAQISHPGVSGKLRVYSSGFHKRPERGFIVESLNIGQILEKGSALKFCDIAQGEVDLYMRFGPTSEWDTAAAQIILEEAGCLLYEAKTLEVMEYGKSNYLNRGTLACHKDIMPQVKSFLENHKPK